MVIGNDQHGRGIVRRTNNSSSGIVVDGGNVEPPAPPPPPQHGGGVEASPSFYCPLTHMVMLEPVQDREGNSYEKGAIEQWLTDNATSPITRNRLRTKHLVPNRALKEAIDHEATKESVREVNRKKHPLPLGPIQRNTFNSGSSAAVRSASTTTVASSSTTARRTTSNNRHHHTIINNFLASLNVKSRIDEYGIAFLQMDKLQSTTTKKREERINMVLVIEAPPTKETFRLYTHFSGSSMENQQPYFPNDGEQEESTSTNAESTSKNEIQVFTNLLRKGRHKALHLVKVCDGRVRFSFEGRNSEINCESKVGGILNMFVKVSVQMKKRLE